MAGISSAIYNTIFRKNAVFLSTVFVGAFAFELGFDKASDKIWDTVNQGRQWKDIRHQYLQKPDVEEEE
ncbi:qcr9 subunit 9 of the ubiquinol cytochrome-c reductase complex [Arachnomyces sp. PD_36]|nr:qcr9 subunit 9 of the ubiquinol cytochrome-c reductase complex [Arachnomyces sp. PD_36]